MGRAAQPSNTQAIAEGLSTSRPTSTTVCNTVIEGSDLPGRISPDQAGIHKNDVLVDVVEKAALSADATTPNDQSAVRDFDLYVYVLDSSSAIRARRPGLGSCVECRV